MDLQSLYLNESQIEKIEQAKKITTKTFWKRQFQIEQTKKQRIFDGVFGIVLPAICFLFDPIVFRVNNAILANYKPFAYLLSYVSIMALLAFMLWGEKLKWLNGFLSGLFGLAAIISLTIGLILSPFSFMGLLLFFIGILGFTPLFTGFVFWRNAVRAFKIAEPQLGRKLAANMLILSTIVSFVVPEIINAKIYKGLKTIETGDAQTIRRTTESLKVFAPIINAESLDTTYYYEDKDLERKAAIGEAYRELSGKELHGN